MGFYHWNTYIFINENLDGSWYKCIGTLRRALRYYKVGVLQNFSGKSIGFYHWNIYIFINENLDGSLNKCIGTLERALEYFKVLQIQWKKYGLLSLKYLHLYKSKFRWIIGTLTRALEYYKVLQILQVLQKNKIDDKEKGFLSTRSNMHRNSKDYMGKYGIKLKKKT